MCCHLIYSDSCFLQLQSPDATPSMRVAALRTMSYALKTLGEVKDSFLCFAYVHLLFATLLTHGLFAWSTYYLWLGILCSLILIGLFKTGNLYHLWPFDIFALMGSFLTDK